jgi:S-adenosyl methyltransferase
MLEGGHLVTDEGLVVPGIDVTRPSVARIYDFWLGGKGTGGVPAARPVYALAAAAVKTGG